MHNMNQLCGCMYLLPLGPPSPPHPHAPCPGRHRASSRAPWITQRLPTSSLFTHGGVYVTDTLPDHGLLPLPVCSLRLRLYPWGAGVLIKMWNDWFVFMKSHAHRRMSLARTLDPLDPWPPSWLSPPLMPAPPAYLHWTSAASLRRLASSERRGPAMECGRLEANSGILLTGTPREQRVEAGANCQDWGAEVEWTGRLGLTHIHCWHWRSSRQILRKATANIHWKDWC